AEGGTTRFKAVIRSDSLYRLTDAGWADLEAYGVTTIVDIRAPTERRARQVRVRGAVDYRNVALLDHAALVILDTLQALDAEHGGSEGYLPASGVPPAVLRRLQERLIEGRSYLPARRHAPGVAPRRRMDFRLQSGRRQSDSRSHQILRTNSGTDS